MGKKSTKEDMNIYFQTRHNAGLTRAEASELLGFISESRLEKIETEKTAIQPEDVVAMAKAYKKPELCNYYCTHECAIGRDNVPEVKTSALSEIVLGILASINALDKQKERLIEITADGIVSDDELHDFVNIQNQLEHIGATVEALKLWVSSTIAEGKIDKEKLEQIRDGR